MSLVFLVIIASVIRTFVSVPIGFITVFTTLFLTVNFQILFESDEKEANKTWKNKISAIRKVAMLKAVQDSNISEKYCKFVNDINRDCKFKKKT